jgi:hypothetical protein
MSNNTAAMIANYAGWRQMKEEYGSLNGLQSVLSFSDKLFKTLRTV